MVKFGQRSSGKSHYYDECFNNRHAYAHWRQLLELLLLFIKIFDKKYYEAFFTETWRPRNMGDDTQDWTTGNGQNRMMLNTDVSSVNLYASDLIIFLY